MKIKSAIIIPHWNGEKLILECLASLKKQTQKHLVIVVDNGSADNSVKLIEQNFPEAIVLKQVKNLGFAGGVNVGIRYALKNGVTYAALFNNDAQADKNWLKNLMQALEKNPKAGIVTGKLMRDDKKHIDSVGEEYSTWGMPFPRGRNQLDKGQFDQPEPVFAATGGASLYRAKMLQEIGLFDEKFFAYFEDTDISFRAHLSGWEIWYEPRALAYHRIGATSSRLGSFTRYHTMKNFVMLYEKNMPALLYLKYSPLYVLYGLRLMVGSFIKGAGWAYFKATGNFLFNLLAISNDRRKIQKARKVSAKQIDNLLYHGLPPKIPRI